ncbi:hypothetical protein C8J57DRAFT_1520797 [Mycena rebaudengoi]|nr:hypothetical protein C8J57DRAFT_1520797 [Mycena rebaudengoi]
MASQWLLGRCHACVTAVTLVSDHRPGQTPAFLIDVLCPAAPQGLIGHPPRPYGSNAASAPHRKTSKSALHVLSMLIWPPFLVTLRL